MHPANFVLLVGTGFLHVGQAGLELPTSGGAPATASHSSGITGASHHALSGPHHLLRKTHCCVCLTASPQASAFFEGFEAFDGKFPSLLITHPSLSSLPLA